jgi:hypothetical protein
MGTISPVATFSYYLLAKHGVLNLATAFTTISWLNKLRGTLNNFPNIYQQFIMVSVSYDRMRDFLLAEEREQVPALSSDGAYAARFDMATLAWYEDEKLEQKKSEANANGKDDADGVGADEKVEGAVGCAASPLDALDGARSKEKVNDPSPPPPSTPLHRPLR